MHILVTGCRGQVGWEVCRQAKYFDFQITATDKHALDISQIEPIRQLFNQQTQSFDLVINAAAYTAVDKAESDEDQAYSVNATGAENLARVAAEYNIPILHISTDYVFNGNATAPYCEQDRVDPQGSYGRTKLAGETLLAAANKQHFILRTSWVFGIEGHNFVKTMLKLGQERDALSVVADQLGCPTFAGHIANALLQLADQINKNTDMPWGIFHFCDNGVTTWQAFAVRIMSVGLSHGLIEKLPTVQPILSKNYPTPATRPFYSGLDCTAFSQAFPAIGIKKWEDGLIQMVQELASQANQNKG